MQLLTTVIDGEVVVEVVIKQFVEGNTFIGSYKKRCYLLKHPVTKQVTLVRPRGRVIGALNVALELIGKKL